MLLSAVGVEKICTGRYCYRDVTNDDRHDTGEKEKEARFLVSTLNYKGRPFLSVLLEHLNYIFAYCILINFFISRLSHASFCHFFLFEFALKNSNRNHMYYVLFNLHNLHIFI